VGDEVCHAALSVLNFGSINPDFNFTYIALIPKTKNPIKVRDFCPISLCNVMYKIILKVIANRLKVVLPHLIFQNQSAFILG
jgi:hypothetical protein